ncbi:MAG TPA: nucleotidyltransferase domain-containing protein [Candidatus Deferrimicrobium sp.]|nr:nucleotidyltransferase domain-containing protein [Candidatus Deferrimicrobium sp.]
MKNDDKELLRIIDIIVKNAFPQKIFLFGSRATDTNHEKSDYDIFVIVENRKNTRKIEKLLYYIMAKEGVGVPVDLMVDTRDKFEKLKGNHYLIYNQVDKYGRVIYERKTTASAMA